MPGLPRRALRASSVPFGGLYQELRTLYVLRASTNDRRGVPGRLMPLPYHNEEAGPSLVSHDRGSGRGAAI